MARFELTSYGLPPLFWGYMLAALGVHFFLMLAIYAPLKKVMISDDRINYILGLLVIALVVLLPIITLGFFFFKKKISKKGPHIKIFYYLFGLCFWKKEIKLDSAMGFKIQTYLDSPNMANLKADPQMRGFQNKGYFLLMAKDTSGATVIIDRHSRKTDLQKIQVILESF